MLNSNDIESVILALSIINFSSNTYHWIGVPTPYIKIPFYEYVREVALELFCELDTNMRNKYGCLLLDMIHYHEPAY